MAELELPGDLRWSDEMADPEGGTIICHNDVCPENVVYREDEAVALLDFDFAAPGRPLWDLAQMARMWSPLRPPELAVGGMENLDPFRRLSVLAAPYGVEASELSSSTSSPRVAVMLTSSSGGDSRPGSTLAR